MSTPITWTPTVGTNLVWTRGKTESPCCKICEQLTDKVETLSMWQNLFLPGWHDDCDCTLEVSFLSCSSLAEVTFKPARILRIKEQYAVRALKRQMSGVWKEFTQHIGNTWDDLAHNDQNDILWLMNRLATVEYDPELTDLYNSLVTAKKAKAEAMASGHFARALSIEQQQAYCAGHNVFMRRFVSKTSGRHWYAHQLENQQWCHGIPAQVEVDTSTWQTLESGAGEGDSDYPFGSPDISSSDGSNILGQIQVAFDRIGKLMFQPSWVQAKAKAQGINVYAQRGTHPEAPGYSKTPKAPVAKASTKKWSPPGGWTPVPKKTPKAPATPKAPTAPKVATPKAPRAAAAPKAAAPKAPKAPTAHDWNAPRDIYGHNFDQDKTAFHWSNPVKSNWRPVAPMSSWNGSYLSIWGASGPGFQIIQHPAPTVYIYKFK